MRHRILRRLLSPVIPIAVLASLAAAGSLGAQGVTTGSVRGTVTDEAGNPVVGAVLTLTNNQTGLGYTVPSREDGLFQFETVTPGGPFTLSARAIGYRVTSQSGIRVGLGQVVTVNLQLQQAAVELSAVNVSAAAENPLVSRGRTGAATYLSDSMVASLPSLSRNFTDFIAAAPQVNGTSVAGQNNRYNNIQIDGGVNNDLFGLGSTGTPGGQVGERPISVEAVKEFQVLIAPFDVRQGGFTGGLVNAITKSGTNQFHGSLFFFGQNQKTGRSVVNRGPVNGTTCSILCPDTLKQFHEYQYGATLSGPIIPNRLLFFATGDLKSRQSPFLQYLSGNASADSSFYGIKSATADRVVSWARTNLNVDPGSSGKVNQDSPDHNFFFKLTGQVTASSQVELTWNDVKASQNTLIRNTTYSCCRDGFELGNGGYTINNKTDTWRLRFNAALGGRYTNELLLGYQRIRDLRNPGMSIPLVFVGGDKAGTAMSFGAERFSQGNQLNQDNYEVTDNLTLGFGHHLVTAGTHNEFFKFYNQFFAGSYGVWVFANADSLVANHPYHYEIALPLRPNGPLAQFKVSQLGGYVQDVWSVTPKLSLTYGIRVDAPSLNTPPDANAGLKAIPFAHVKDDGSRTPSDTMTADTRAFTLAALWSPRLGFNYDVHGDQSTLIRGGVGVFSGRPPYVWVSNAFANSGVTQALLSCGPTSPPTTAPNADTLVPAFTPGILNGTQPVTCRNGAGATASRASVVYFDHAFKFPQTMRIALGGDQRLPWGMVGTVDFLYTRTLNQFYLNDVNLQGVQYLESGEGGRPMYGTEPTTGTTAAAVAPLRVNTTTYNDVIRQSNSSGDNSVSLTLQLNKRFSDHLEFNAGYTYSKTKDRMCMTSSISNSNLRFAVLQGPLDNRPLATSCFDVPSKLALTAIFDIPLGFKASLIYTGQSGTPFTYTVNNDANGDGLAGNDPIYVPRDSADISLVNGSDWAKLNAYINGESCLNSARGTLLKRNTCRNPWQSFINARLQKSFPTLRGQSFELTLDVFNLPNLISSSWGVIHSTTGFENQAILNIASGTSGYDVAAHRSRYTLLNTTGQNVVQLSTRYRLLLSGKYVF
jgi:hypothetical protein